MTGARTQDCASFQDTHVGKAGQWISASKMTNPTGCANVESMKRRLRHGVAAALLGVLAAAAQVPGGAPAAKDATATTDATDAALTAARLWIGRALILRGFWAANELEYDAQGVPKKPGKTVDWTLAGMNLDKVVRRPDGDLELDGERVAIRYNPDQHSFERHTLNQTHLRVVFPARDPTGVNRTMAAIFSTGIDPALERSMPPYWSHYFLPQQYWPSDGLETVTIIPAGGKLPEGAVQPVAEKKPEPDYTTEARADRVKGTVSLRVTVDEQGVSRRVTIRQPLGYGLDKNAAEAVEHWQFRPGLVEGKPAAMEVTVNQQFDLVSPPG